MCNDMGNQEIQLFKKRLPTQQYSKYTHNVKNV